VAMGGVFWVAVRDGLRRHRFKKAEATRWELNWLSNHPIQGSAAVIFKVAGNRLHTLFKQYDAHLLIPLHDSFVFEAPLELLEEVANETEKVMCRTVQDFFPTLKPRAEINLLDTSCWNKNGCSNSLEKWLATDNNK
jgi:DNA polymerase-1